MLSTGGWNLCSRRSWRLRPVRRPIVPCTRRTWRRPCRFRWRVRAVAGRHRAISRHLQKDHRKDWIKRIYWINLLNNLPISESSTASRSRFLRPKANGLSRARLPTATRGTARAAAIPPRLNPTSEMAFCTLLQSNAFIWNKKISYCTSTIKK